MVSRKNLKIWTIASSKMKKILLSQFFNSTGTFSNFNKNQKLNENSHPIKRHKNEILNSFYSHIPVNNPVEFDLAPIRSKRLGNSNHLDKFSKPQMDSPEVNYKKVWFNPHTVGIWNFKLTKFPHFLQTSFIIFFVICLQWTLLCALNQNYNKPFLIRQRGS